jgi:hypothetical protein
MHPETHASLASIVEIMTLKYISGLHDFRIEHEIGVPSYDDV